jgi:hypothetical protein
MFHVNKIVFRFLDVPLRVSRFYALRLLCGAEWQDRRRLGVGSTSLGGFKILRTSTAA